MSERNTLIQVPPVVLIGSMVLPVRVVVDLKDENGEAINGLFVYGPGEDAGIYLNAALSAPQLARTFWHELAHVFAYELDLDNIMDEGHTQALGTLIETSFRNNPGFLDMLPSWNDLIQHAQVGGRDVAVLAAGE